MNWASERGNIAAMAKVEACLADTYHEYGLLDSAANQEIRSACDAVTVEEVYAEEQRTRHQVRALVNVIRRRAGTGALWVHLGATSSDIVDTANAYRFKQLLADAKHHNVREAAHALHGQMSGAVGTYASFDLLVQKPREFERAVLRRLGLTPAGYSNQIVPPDQWADLAHAMVSVMPTEWRILYGPRVVTTYMDQISEHQRDLTNSASSRFLSELVDAYLRI